MDMTSIQNFLSTTIAELAIKVLAAIAFWVIGRWIIGRVIALVQAGMNRNHVDPTLTKYLGSIIAVGLWRYGDELLGAADAACRAHSTVGRQRGCAGRHGAAQGSRGKYS